MSENAINSLSHFANEFFITSQEKEQSKKYNVRKRWGKSQKA